MTLQEVAQRLRYNERTIYKNFKRTQDALAKKGILLTKNKTDYFIEYTDLDDESHKGGTSA